MNPVVVAVTFELQSLSTLLLLCQASNPLRGAYVTRKTVFLCSVGVAVATLFALTVFVDSEHRNRKLLCLVCAHYPLQLFNDLTKPWLRGTFSI